ncbi:UvrD-helicase domain-containing protein, partial [Thermodesulfobacteriota bacterium]
MSYTNVAVNEIRVRLGRSGSRAQVSTIHSFLYNNVVKPYLHLLKDESGDPLVKHEFVDGHDEHRPTFSAVKGWLDSVGARIDFYRNQHEIFAYLKKVHWQLEEGSGEWILKSSEWNRPKYLPSIKSGSYKQFYWRIGVIDHEDVLYLAYRILEENPVVSEFLSCRFPFLFIDEFQDTNPVQTQVVKWLADSNTTVGVIGDPEQSIYGFQGAKLSDFLDFSLPGQIDYVINDNRRSTDSIIQLLNHVRCDEVVQKGLRGVPGQPVQIFVGDVSHVVSK